MRRIFLGPLWHWLLIVVICAVGWFAGAERIHVISFNFFVICLLAASAVAVLAILATARPGAQVTRDPIEDEAGDG